MELQATKIALPALMTTEEAARYLGVSIAWFERDRWSGPSVPYVRFGRRIRYRADDLKAFIENAQVEAID